MSFYLNYEKQMERKHNRGKLYKVSSLNFLGYQTTAIMHRKFFASIHYSSHAHFFSLKVIKRLSAVQELNEILCYTCV